MYIYIYYYKKCGYCDYIKKISDYLNLKNQIKFLDIEKAKNTLASISTNISLPIIFYINENDQKVLINSESFICMLYEKFNLINDKKLLLKVLNEDSKNYNMFLFYHGNTNYKIKNILF